MANAATPHGPTRRNAPRRAAQLPLLDMHKEQDKDVSLAAWCECWAIRKTCAAQEADILANVLEAVHQTPGPGFPCIPISWVGMRVELNQGMNAIPARQGVLRPEFLGGPRHGSGRARDPYKDAAFPSASHPAA